MLSHIKSANNIATNPIMIYNKLTDIAMVLPIHDTDSQSDYQYISTQNINIHCGIQFFIGYKVVILIICKSLSQGSYNLINYF